jgi:enamine deaminase RidA (YjgF/YER057c/UK114 family)
MTRIPALARGVLAFGAGSALLFGASACSFETVFTTTEEDGTADRAQALSAPGSADLWRTSGTGPDALNDDAEPGTPMEFVDPVLLEDGELPERMSVTEAQSLQVLQKIADMVEAEGRRISEVASLRVYLAPDPSADGGAGEDAAAADFEGWNRAYRTFFANLDPFTGDSLLTGTSAVTLTAETSPSPTSTTSEPSDPPDQPGSVRSRRGRQGRPSRRPPSAPSTDRHDRRRPGEDSEDDAPYSGEMNPTKPTVVTVGVAEQPVDGWLVQVEAEVIYDNE